MVSNKNNELWIKTITSERFISMQKNILKKQKNKSFKNIFRCISCKLGKPCLLVGEKLGLTSRDWNDIGIIIQHMINEDLEYDIVFKDNDVQKIWEALRDPFCSFECKNWYKSKKH